MGPSGVSEGTEAQLGTSDLFKVGVTDGEFSGINTVSGAIVATGRLSGAGSRANKCCSKLLSSFGAEDMLTCRAWCVLDQPTPCPRSPFKDFMAHNTNLRPQMACGQQCETLLCKTFSSS